MSHASSTSEILGHPKGLFVCFMTEMWERFAFYGMKTLLLFYLIEHHRFTDANGYLLLGTYAGLAYALPLLGGMLADRFMGMRNAVVVGGVLLVLGQLGMAYTGAAAVNTNGVIQQDGFAIQVMYFSLALIILGVGYLKPNISTIVGRLYAENDPRRDSGFTIFYMGINIGAMIASIACAEIAEKYGWGAGFGLAGVLMLVGLVFFLTGQRHFHGVADASNPQAIRQKIAGMSIGVWIALGTVICLLLVWQLMQMELDFPALNALFDGHKVTATEIVAVVMGSALLAWLFKFTFSNCDATQRQQMWVLFSLTAVSALFWGLYEQSYGPWVAIAERATDLAPLTVFGYTMDAKSTTFFGGFFVVLLSPIFAWLWPRLDRAALNPSSPMKFALALALCGLAFGVLAFGAANPGASGKMNGLWIVAAYLVLVLGEMALSPIGLSLVTKLSVPRVVGLMMGAWFLFSAFGEIIAGRLATWSAIDTAADGSVDVALALSTYSAFFKQMMWVGLIAGGALALVTPLLKRGMHGVK